MPERSTLGRSAVGLALLAAGVHGMLAADAWSRSTTTALLLVGMAAACLTCTPSLWRGGSLRSWMTMLGITGAMLYAHWALCFACGPAVHDESDLDVGVATHLFAQGLGSVALWLMVAEMTLAVAAVLRLLQHPNHNNPEVVPS